MKGFVYMNMKTKTINRAVEYCWKEKKPCARWAHKYFKDCLCNIKDDFSFGFGIISLVAWGVAEVPQIITNFRSKSSHGVSLLFLVGWFLGDIFNLAGCLLEPATLPTQFYTAFLYTVSTIVLVLQSLCYDHFYKLLKSHQNKSHEEVDQEEKRPLNPKPKDDDEAGIPIPSAPVRAPIRRFYTSARSLAGSDTPPFRSYLRSGPRSGPSAFEHIDHSSSSDDEATNPIPIPIKRGATTLPRQISRPAAQGAILAASINLPIGGNALSQAYRGFTGRRMLSEHSSEHSELGQWLGWLMAAIYMGGRIPQIIWNIKRGSVEGLNPLMFVFALVANVAYVASILVRHTEFEEIKANMPWLLDAIVCVALDLFIIIQYVYYKHMRTSRTREEGLENYYVEAQKPVVS